MRRREVVIYAGAVLFSLLGHFGLLRGLGAAAAIVPRQRQRVVELAVIEKPPPKPELPPPPKPAQPPKLDRPVVNLPPPPNTNTSSAPPEEAKPIFGVSLSSVVGPGSGSGFRVRVGNTLMKDPDEPFTPPEEVRAYAPVPLYQVSRPPRYKDGRACKPPYPPEAKKLGIEGRVEVEVEVRADGSVGEVRVLKGVGHGLDEAAVATMRSCLFEPAEIQGRAVATRISVGITFVIEE